MNRTPSPAAIVAFLKAAELGSFAAAAKQLTMSPAAVGQAVARLEQSLGVKLLNRTTRRMSVTSDGRELVTRGEDVLRGLSEIERVFEERRGLIAGPLRVSAPRGLARRHIVPLVARFLAEHPRVEVVLDSSDTVRDLVAESIDVAFRILRRPADSAWVARRITQLPAVTVASPAYLERHGVPKHPDDLAAHTGVGYRFPGTSALSPFRFRVGGRQLTYVPRSSLTVNDAEAGCEAAVVGLGVVQPPTYFVTEHLARGTLVKILDRYAPEGWGLYVCYQSAKRLPMRARAFVDLARSELASEPWMK